MSVVLFAIPFSWVSWSDGIPRKTAEDFCKVFPALSSCDAFCSVQYRAQRALVRDRQSDITQAQQTQSTDKPETIATDTIAYTGERSREFKLELPLSQTNPRGSALFSFLIETDPYIQVPLRLSLMHLTDKILFQTNFR